MKFPLSKNNCFIWTWLLAAGLHALGVMNDAKNHVTATSTICSTSVNLPTVLTGNTLGGHVVGNIELEATAKTNWRQFTYAVSFKQALAPVS